ncbi:hypothetical protein CCUS01_06994 [Colletotrichum cuscutae]|uniref:Uncharacterized protein n=1 Tax=Colletotrichum cuscutae TaxID=1209917 RepID=A0AAI9V2X0_9PEZI|nr:hypothetical protein CCUS01_06994 [Colletotrichum cuscutae]
MVTTSCLGRPHYFSPFNTHCIAASCPKTGVPTTRPISGSISWTQDFCLEVPLFPTLRSLMHSLGKTQHARIIYLSCDFCAKKLSTTLGNTCVKGSYRLKAYCRIGSLIRPRYTDNCAGAN